LTVTNDLAFELQPPDTAAVMIPTDFNPHRRLASRVEAQTVLDETVRQACTFLRIFDDRGEFYGFERSAFAAALREFLTRDRQAQAIIIVHDSGHIERNCARINGIARRYSPQVRIYVADESLRNYARGMVISDQGVLISRPQFGQAATFVDYDEKAVANALALFSEINQTSQLMFSGTVSGL
jgi:hypothetical protein